MSTKPDLSRRNFLFNWKNRLSDAQETPWEQYFSSYEMAYAQVNEARPFLAEDARRLGIDTKGMSDLEILKAIFATTSQPQSQL